MNYKESRNLMWISLAVGLLIMVIGLGLKSEKSTLVFMIVGTVAIALGIMQAFIFYLCPHCGYSLMNVRGGIPKHCPKCGKELSED